MRAAAVALLMLAGLCLTACQPDDGGSDRAGSGSDRAGSNPRSTPAGSSKDRPDASRSPGPRKLPARPSSAPHLRHDGKQAPRLLPAAKRRAAAGAALAESVEAAVPAPSGRYAIGVLDTTGKIRATVRGSDRFVTGSAAKVDILVCLLLDRQDSGGLTAYQRELADRMIRISDNKKADKLLAELGGTERLAACHRRLGLLHTTAGVYGRWGLTTTTVKDRLRLLNVLAAADSPLSAASRQYALGLMRSVAPEQAWGAPVAAGRDEEPAPAVKNGWLPRDRTGRWVINSTGLIRRDGHELLVAVLSDNLPGYPAGTAQVERLVRAAVPAVLKAEHRKGR